MRIDERIAVGSGDADVIDERVEPNVGDESGSKGRGMPQFEAAAGRVMHKILELIVFEEAEDLVAADFGLR